MARNSIPESYEALIQLLEDAADGARNHGAAAQLKQNDEAALRKVLVALSGAPAGPGGVPPAQPGLKSLWNAAKAEKTTRTAALRSQISNGRTLAASCVSVLKLHLGRSWSSAWNAVGFNNGSLAQPDNPQALLQQLSSYLAAHPEYEVPKLSGSVAVTAAACTAAADAIGDAASASNTSNTLAGAAKKALEDGIAAARSRLSGLRAELTQTLSEDDPLWYAFGFQRPSDESTPEVPLHVVVTVGAPGSGSVFLDWDDARRADAYRVTLSTTANPPVELVSRRVTDSETTLTGLPPGAFQVEVTSINDAGESQPSAAVKGVLV